jgi:WD40 repeat protein
MDGRGQRAVRYAVEILLGFFLLLVGPVPWQADAQPRAERPAGGPVTATLATVLEHDHGVLALAWSPDGRWLATGGPLSHRLTAWEVDRRAPAWRVDAQGTADYVAWGPQGRYVAVAGFAPSRNESGVRLLDAGSGILIGHLDRPPGGPGRVSALAWRPDGQRLAASYYGRRQVAIYDAPAGRLVRTFDVGADPSDALAFDPDGRLLAAGLRNPAEGYPVRVIDAESGRVVRTLGGHDIDARAVAWSRDGRRLVAQFRGGPLNVYAWPKGTLERRIEALHASSPTPAFVPDGRLLLAAGADVGIWSVESWQRVATFAHVTTPLSVIALAPDGRRLATAGNVRVAVWTLSR